MIDLNKIEKYKEISQIEVSGRLTNNIWSAYSSFANTLGGIILLGVEENADKTLCANGLSDPEKNGKRFLGYY